MGKKGQPRRTWTAEMEAKLEAMLLQEPRPSWREVADALGVAAKMAQSKAAREGLDGCVNSEDRRAAEDAALAERRFAARWKQSQLRRRSFASLRPGRPRGRLPARPGGSNAQSSAAWMAEGG